MSKFATIKAGDPLPEREYAPDNVQLFLYDAALWNAHRIHFDHLYTTEVEGYPGLVVPGPLMGDWLTQCVNEWLGADGTLVSIEFSNRKAAYIGEILRTGGSVLAIEPDMSTDTGTARLELFVKNAADEIIVPGIAVVDFAAATSGSA
jgi:3-methylfumaryl-CoA hydratase